MKKQLLIFCGALLLSISMFAQRDETLANKVNFRITGAWGGSTHSMSFFQDDVAYTNGGFGGVEIGKNFLIGGGGEQMARRATVNERGNELRLDYGGFMVGYAPSAWRVLHPQFNFMIGGGEATIYDDDGFLDRDNVFVASPSLGFEVNVFRWFRIQAQGGYRFVSQANFAEVSSGDMSSPYAQLGLKFGWSWGK